MATTTIMTDDLSGEADANSYKLINPEDGRTYSIDLAAKNYDKLCKALAPFLEKARPATPEPIRAASQPKAHNAQPQRYSITQEAWYDKDAYEAWAQSNGIATGKRPKTEHVQRWATEVGLIRP